MHELSNSIIFLNFKTSLVIAPSLPPNLEQFSHRILVLQLLTLNNGKDNIINTTSQARSFIPFLQLLKFVSRHVFHCQFLITYIFSVSLMFGVCYIACYITGQWGEFWVKNATFCLHVLFWHFFVLHQKNCLFIILISFFDKVSNFRNRILTN